ncbi:MAG: type II toxin-antitoxin system PemK/MazF family toxin [Fusicatenibacter sp.]
MKEDWVYRRGDLYLANLGKPVGSQQGGVRPVVVLQNDVGNYYAPTITIAPLTSKVEKKKKQPTHFYLRKAKGLQRPSMVLAEQMGTYDKSCIIRYIGRVSKGQMRGIDNAVKNQLGFFISEYTERNIHRNSIHSNRG